MTIKATQDLVDDIDDMLTELACLLAGADLTAEQVQVLADDLSRVKASLDHHVHDLSGRPRKKVPRGPLVRPSRSSQVERLYHVKQAAPGRPEAGDAAEGP